ncbi:sensor histidine kinase [Jeotgalicoccus psychrophilus]|uniref:sensor histidine kinase n=1 Tax=Jeotgalicoccus psychrophilus TaxID=157228 RepID=UPI0003FD64C8|nr:HAMP domain-containing sensor histidine kinase [Jeotgalicoccus psychrophilus]
MLFQLLACLTIATLIIMNLKNKIEIKELTKQVDFIKNHETNKLLTGVGNNKEINRLINQLNQLILLQREITKEYRIKDEVFKETLTNISHDIRTPLTSLTGYFQLLVETEDEEEREKYLAIIHTRIGHLRNILEDLFTYTKVQDHHYQLQQENCDLTKILQKNLLSYYEEFNRKNIEPQLTLSNKPLIILSNQVALDRVFSNLINNSLNHGKKHVGVRLVEEKGQIIIIFENDVEEGVIIDFENVFTRFYKSDPARTVNSTGLGLTIVKEFIESMDGTIQASVNENIFRIQIILTDKNRVKT